MPPRDRDSEKYGYSDCFTIFSKNKVYKNTKLVSKNYEAIIFIKASWEEANDNWLYELQRELSNNNVNIPYVYANENFKKVEVKRIKTPYKTSLNISTWAKACKEGGIMFVKSGQNAYLIKYPACMNIQKLAIKAGEFFNKK